MADWQIAAISSASALAGSAITLWAEARRQRHAHADLIADSLRTRRVDAYQEFIREAHLAAHLIGRTAPGCPQPLDDSPEILARVDSEVARRLYEIELFAEEQPLLAARAVRIALLEFRRVVETRAVYMEQSYREALAVYQKARSEYLAAVRAAVLGE
jgi:hypothetical protein